MVKQAESLKCTCGQAVIFPEGEIRTKCQTKGCKTTWEICSDGYWLPVAYVKPKKLNHYEKYMRWRNQQRSCQK